MIGMCSVRMQTGIVAGAILSLIVVSLGCATAGLHGKEIPLPADLLVVDARILVSAIPERRAQALAIRDGRVVAVGSTVAIEGYAGERTHRIEAAGRVVIPGLIDSHAHLWGLARNRLRVDLVGTRSYAEVIDRMRARAGSVPEGQWVEGRGWDQNDWEDVRFPVHGALSEALSAHPVALRRVDGHALLVNARALAHAGIDRGTPDPPGGRILRDSAGEPTGVLIDHAMGLVLEAIPQPSRERMRVELAAAMDQAVSLGLTGVHDMGLSRRAAEVYDALGRGGDLPLRVVGFWEGESPESEQWMKSPPVRGAHEGRWSMVGVKLYQDGALGSRGAALLEDYADEPGHRGQIFHEASDLAARIRTASVAGYQVGVHAIGDRANRMALDAFEEVAARGGEARLLRPRIEHAQVIALSDIARFGELGVLAMVQPTHATSDMPWAEARLGPDRIQGAYAWRRLKEAGAHLALGSDFPVERVNPLLGIYAAITRSDASGSPAAGWRPEERLTPAEALDGFTASAAYAAGMEADLGTLEVGKWGDFVLLDVDPLRDPPGDLLGAKIALTVVGGDIQYAAPAWAFAPRPDARR
jgi:hypothetical protein